MYSLSLNLRINWISCPGVWLCAKGYVVVKLTTLGGIQWSKKLFPKFPILVGELFAFERVIFGDINSLMAALERELVRIELIQWMSSRAEVGIILATFSRRLSHFFDRLVIGESGVSASSRLTQMLMKKTEYFPGIISPKFTCSLQLRITTRGSHVRCKPSLTQDRVHHSLRQRSVCHSNVFVPHQYDGADGNCYHHWMIPKERSQDWEENGIIHNNENKIKYPFCLWCDDTKVNLRCACYSCQEYHLAFH